jgi:hypothetical protein
VCPPFQFDHEPPLQCNETKETTGQLNGDQTRKCEELEVKTPESSFSQKRKARVGLLKEKKLILRFATVLNSRKPFVGTALFFSTF